MSEMNRQERMDQVTACGQADRVPFCINANNFYSLEYGSTIYEVMKDARFFDTIMKQYVTDFDPDFVGMPITYPIDAFRLMDYQNVKYPGPDYNLPADTPFQFLDAHYMDDEEYDLFLDDPSGYVFRNVFTRQYAALAPLANLSVMNFCNASIYGMAAFGNPAVQAALKKMMQTGDIVSSYLAEIGRIGAEIEKMGYPIFGLSGALNPFDAFADSVRGIMELNMDMLEDPDVINETLKKWGDRSIGGDLFAAKSTGSKYVFMPLHCGGESFMSVDDFQEIYWPQVRRYADAFIKEGLVPIMFCEGGFTSRLEILADIEPGKVIYLFEDVDYVQAKKNLEGKACIMGGMKTQTLMFGSKEDVIEETKQILDICAPGGGFIMSNSIALDQVKRENVEAWREATLKYGTY